MHVKTCQIFAPVQSKLNNETVTLYIPNGCQKSNYFPHTPRPIDGKFEDDAAFHGRITNILLPKVKSITTPLGEPLNRIAARVLIESALLGRNYNILKRCKTVRVQRRTHHRVENEFRPLLISSIIARQRSAMIFRARVGKRGELKAPPPLVPISKFPSRGLIPARRSRVTRFRGSREFGESQRSFEKWLLFSNEDRFTNLKKDYFWKLNRSNGKMVILERIIFGN